MVMHDLAVLYNYCAVHVKKMYVLRGIDSRRVQECYIILTKQRGCYYKIKQYA